MIISLSLVGGIGWIVVNQSIDVINELPNWSFSKQLHPSFPKLADRIQPEQNPVWLDRFTGNQKPRTRS